MKKNTLYQTTSPITYGIRAAAEIVVKAGNNPLRVILTFSMISCEDGELRSPSIRLRSAPRTGAKAKETVNRLNINHTFHIP